jgi:hypothetical protein
MKIGNTVCKPDDKKLNRSSGKKENGICSRCGKVINGIVIEIRPSFETAFRRNDLCYRYHEECIETNWMILKTNWLRFWILAKLERIHHQLIFLEFFGLGYNQMKRKRKGK